MRATQRYQSSYLDALERSMSFLSDYAKAPEWPAVSELGPTHIEDYLVHFARLERWFGEMVADAVPGQPVLPRDPVPAA